MNKIKRFWKSIGPGLITGASDNDFSGIITYAIAGAKFGLASIWTMLYSLPLMVIVQEMSARIGISSSCGLTGNIKKYYSRSLLVFISTLIIVSNIFNIGADIYGMAASIELITPNSTLTWSFVIVFFIIGLVIFLPYRRIVSIFKWLAMFLLVYVVAAFLVVDEWRSAVMAIFIPKAIFSKEYLLMIVAMFGTTVSPYLAFWQASEEAEEAKLKNSINGGPLICKFREISDGDIKRTMRDTRIGMFFSNFVGFFIIALCSSALFSTGITNVDTIQQVASALKPLAGDYAYYLFAAGAIGSGLLAIPILAGSSAYVLSEMFGWKGSLTKSFSKAREFYLVIIGATLLGLLIPIFGISPVKALIWTSIIHGIVAPFLIGTIIHMANNPKIVGPNVNSTANNAMAYLALLVMSLVLIIFFVAHTPLFN